MGALDECGRGGSGEAVEQVLVLPRRLGWSDTRILLAMCPNRTTHPKTLGTVVVRSVVNCSTCINQT
jgi:hypothetical protein